MTEVLASKEVDSVMMGGTIVGLTGPKEDGDAGVACTLNGRVVVVFSDLLPSSLTVFIACNNAATQKVRDSSCMRQVPF